MARVFLLVAVLISALVIIKFIHKSKVQTSGEVSLESNGDVPKSEISGTGGALNAKNKGLAGKRSGANSGISNQNGSSFVPLDTASEEQSRMVKSRLPSANSALSAIEKGNIPDAAIEKPKETADDSDPKNPPLVRTVRMSKQDYLRDHENKMTPQMLEALNNSDRPFVLSTQMQVAPTDIMVDSSVLKTDCQILSQLGAPVIIRISPQGKVLQATSMLASYTPPAAVNNCQFQPFVPPSGVATNIVAIFSPPRNH